MGVGRPHKERTLEMDGLVFQILAIRMKIK